MRTIMSSRRCVRWGGRRGRELARLGRGHVPPLIRRWLPFARCNPLSTVAPEFVEMAHRIVWCVVGTDRRRRLSPYTDAPPDLGVGRRLAHRLDRHLAHSPKAADLRAKPEVSITYWSPNHDTCTADCAAARDHAGGTGADGPGSPTGRTGRLRPGDHPGLGPPRVARVRHPPARRRTGCGSCPAR